MKTTLLPLHELRRHPDNARERGEYAKKDLADLVASIEGHGLLQPLVVSKDDKEFTILAGHRRHAALSALGRETAPCIVLEGDERESLAVLLTENAQHRAVNPLREADAVAKLVEGCSGEEHPYDRAAVVLGKSPAWVRGRMRLTALSASWRKAHGAAESPIHEFPVGHLEVVAALPQAVQDQILEEGWFTEGVPLAADLRSWLADFTRDLSRVPWDVDAANVVDGVAACSVCPKRDSEGDLFGGCARGKGARCLDALCFAAKKRAAVHARIAEAKAAHGDALAVEVAWGSDDVPMPDGVSVYREHELVPLAKGKGGIPVLRLRTMKVAWMGKASRRFDAERGFEPEPIQPEKTGPRPIEERRKELEKRRQIRAIEIFRGSMLGRPVSVGTKKRPEETTPPTPEVPALLDVVALAVAYGTGPSVDEEQRLDGAPTAETLGALLRQAGDDETAHRLRVDLWNRVREPVARALRILGPLKPNAVADLAGQARAVAGACSLDWEREFLASAIAAIPDPKSWTTAPRSRRA